MKVAVTGASGFVGSMLIPALLARGCKLVLFGRDVEQLAAQFPNTEVRSYGSLEKDILGVNVVVHMAAINNNQAASDAEVQSVNCDFMLDVAAKAHASAVPRFIFVSSVHALDVGNKAAYARSKRDAAGALASMKWDAAQIVYLPLVYGAYWPGKLGALNRWPKSFAVGTFRILAAIKPVCHISHLVEYVLSDVNEKESILADNADLNWVYSFLKRTGDLVFCALIITFLGWALVLVWLAVRLSSPGPGIFKQERLGKHGKPFFLYKFRSMRQGTRQAGTHEISLDEVTRIGRFIRRSKIDELPQVLNILRNEISLIGPRPCLPNQTELVRRRHSAGIFDMKPGISGYAQVQGLDMSDPKKLVANEARYMKLRSLSLDLRIILATARGSGQGDRTAH